MAAAWALGSVTTKVEHIYEIHGAQACWDNQEAKLSVQE